jgi:hypothetical protein
MPKCAAAAALRTAAARFCAGARANALEHRLAFAAEQAIRAAEDRRRLGEK